MSITDSSTSLDHTWTEQSIVSFTTGVLSDIDACVTEVQSKLKRGTLSASTTPTLTEVKNWLKRYKMELAESKRFTFSRKFASVSTVAGTYRYALPPDYNGGNTRLRDTTNDRPIKIWMENFFDAKYPDVSAESRNEIGVACVKNMELWVAPPPSGVFTLELEYDRSGAETTTDDFAWIPELDRFRICDGATAEAFESLGDFNRASIFRRKWEYGLDKATKADGRRRWKNMHFQAYSVFQHRTMTGNQQLDD